MEQFSLEKYLENPSRKVVTRDGRKVKIVWCELKCHTPIIAAIQWNQEREDAYCYDTAGRCANNVGELDLFFADDEEEKESTEFDKCLLSAFYSVAGKAVTTIGTASFQEDVDEWGKPLLNLARKEFQITDYLNGYTQGKQDTLKAALESLPKWRKSDDNLPYPYIGGLGKEFLVKKGYYIKISDLETLPKE